ncbi:MAG: glutamate racemase [Actinobacteria bacterium]|nr:MAG: glutamate racemase [Actinomycetota bacterium]
MDKVRRVPRLAEAVEENDRGPPGRRWSTGRLEVAHRDPNAVAHRHPRVRLGEVSGCRPTGRHQRCQHHGEHDEDAAHEVHSVSRRYDRPVDPRPVGVFDSGVGGLTVLHECLVTMPHEDFVYLGDHARLPYGPRPLDEVQRFAREIGAYLQGQGVKLVVNACNTATSAALPQLQEELDVPVVGVITPEAHAAVQATRNRRIGLLATEGTVRAGRYAELVQALDAGAQLVSVACPRLVPLIESEDPFGAETTDTVREYARELKDASVDTVILGCTHYPLIRPIFQRVFGRDVTLVFSAEETAREVAETLSRKGYENNSEREGSYRFLTTGDPGVFRTMGARFLQLPIDEVEHVDLAVLGAAA